MFSYLKLQANFPRIVASSFGFIRSIVQDIMKITLATLQTAESEAPKIPDEASLPEDQELADQCPVNTLEQIEHVDPEVFVEQIRL